MRFNALKPDPFAVVFNGVPLKKIVVHEPNSRIHQSACSTISYIDFDQVIGFNLIFQSIIEQIFSENVKSLRPKNLDFHTVLDRHRVSVFLLFFPEFGEMKYQGYTEKT